ncbi:hypothetical protein [Nocardioides sp.]|uniref:hypothetical protein n=1 Tax=Nocardioides sp. TaxID=35761 RepID=UPI00286D0599|nr:hypothetical protein [Nocardioides sp.]
MTRLQVVGLLLAAMLLSGCTSNTANPTDRPASAPVPTQSPSPWPPASVLEEPEPDSPAPSMGRQGKARVQDYVSYLLDEIDYALRTTFPAAVLRSDARCRICGEVVDSAERARADRVLYDFDDWGGYLLLARELPITRPGARFWRVRLILWQPEIEVRDQAGELVETIAGRNRETVLDLGHTANEWAINYWSDAAAAPPPDVV